MLSLFFFSAGNKKSHFLLFIISLSMAHFNTVFFILEMDVFEIQLETLS